MVQSGSNIPDLSVSELSFALKRMVEQGFSHVRVRGEISGFKRASSGHLYFALKDDQSVLDAVCWKGSAGRLSAVPEDGLEVIATGKLTTFPGRSKYQIVVEDIEIAGAGALLKLLEDRKRLLAAEGLFSAERKRPLPYLPEVIGVVTSPTGAVIRDILHRLADRFPRPVLVWPVLVQGEGAAVQIAAAIRGFNALPRDGDIPRPDVLIVARGGGSLEDLWAFNEEVVVRAAAESAIPLISAVGHETDTTLIDFASDRRAPTPTAAAEMAVPVRADILAEVMDDGRRLVSSMARMLEDRRIRLEGLARGLPDAPGLIEPMAQRLDDLAERLPNGAQRLLGDRAQRLANAAARLVTPAQMLAEQSRRLEELATRADGAAARRTALSVERLAGLAQRLSPRTVTRLAEDGERRLGDFNQRLTRHGNRLLGDKADRLAEFGTRLEANSYKGVLKRGYAVLRDGDGRLLADGDAARAAGRVEIEFRGEDRVSADILGADTPPPSPKPATAKPRKPVPAPPGQGELL